MTRVAATVSIAAAALLAGGAPAYAADTYPTSVPGDGSGPLGLFLLFVVIAAVVGIGGFLWRLSAARRIAQQAGLDPDSAVTTAMLSPDGLAATYLAANLRPQPAEQPYHPVGHLDPPSSRRTPESRLTELKGLHDQGLITDAEYDRRRTEIVNSV